MTIGASKAHTCLIDKNKEIKCYGYDNHAQVSDTPTSDTYNFISSGDNLTIVQYLPQLLKSLVGVMDNVRSSFSYSLQVIRIISFLLDEYHNCAISSTTFRIICWGYDDLENQVSRYSLQVILII